MTLVGKIFTMLIFVLSIIFMAFSIMVFATHRNWRTQAGKLQADLAVLQTQKKDADDALMRAHRLELPVGFDPRLVGNLPA